MQGMAAANPYIGGLSAIMGLIGGLQQQSANSSAINGITGNLNTVLGGMGGDANSMISNYLQKAMPELNALVQQLGPEQQQAFGSAMGAFGNAQGNATALENNPYLGNLGMMAGKFLTPGSTPSMQSIGNVAQQLMAWHGLRPQELNALTMQSGDAARSAAQTMKQQMGGVANPAALMAQLANQAGITGQQTAVGIGAQAAGQELGAKESAGQLYGTMAGDQIAKLQDALNAYSTQSGQYLQGQEAAGQLNLGAGQGYSGLSGQALSAMLNSLGLQQQGMQTGMGALGNISNTYGSLLNDYLGMQQGAGNPFTSALSSLYNIFMPQGGGAVGGAPSPSPMPS